MIELYECTNKHLTITRNELGDGIVLPMFITCTQCNETATQAPKGLSDLAYTPTYEWYIPEKKQRGITKEEKRKWKRHGVFLKRIL